MAAEEKILALVDEYVNACLRGDVTALRRLYWLEDPRFSEVYAVSPLVRRPCASDAAAEAPPTVRVRPRHVRVHFLSLEVAYCLVPCEALATHPLNASYITLLFLKKGSDWKIIHSHLSRRSVRE